MCHFFGAAHEKVHGFYPLIVGTVCLKQIQYGLVPEIRNQPEVGDKTAQFVSFPV